MKLFILGVFGLSLVGCTHAAKPASAPAAPAAPVVNYVDGATYATMAFDGPPVADSAAYKKDLEGIQKWQKKRTDADCAKVALTSPVLDFDQMFGKLSPFSSPISGDAKDFFQKIRSDGTTALKAIKKRFPRQRPYELAGQGIKACPAQTNSNDSYPAGHLYSARIFALVLGELKPAQKNDFIARSEEIGTDKIIGGVHFQSDIDSGRALADTFFKQLVGSEKFQADLAKIKAAVH